MFVELGKRLNALREKYADIQQSSLDFLRELLELARDTVAAEKADRRDTPRGAGQGRADRTVRGPQDRRAPRSSSRTSSTGSTRSSAGVRFEGWQSTIRGDQEVRKALRKTLYVQFKIRDNDVFEKALGYVREYY